MSDKKSSGKIITFYSYKGGTGRSMSLANVAWVLASAGKRVLTVDWDLEAPGLHRYFRPFLLDKDLTSSEGVLDLVLDYAVEAITPASSRKERAADWYHPYANVLRYAVSLRWKFPGQGRLDFIPAGRQIASYASRMNSFDWRNFYERLGGSAFLETMKEGMREEYDYVLIDSRTGVSDTSGICTIQMPDVLVVCFTLNNQSIDGAASVAASVREQRGIPIYPVPMRVEVAEKRKLGLRKEYARDVFSAFPSHIAEEKREHYMELVQYPYIPFYAYEEILATFGDEPRELNTVLKATEWLVFHLTDGEVTKWTTPADVDREQVLAYYEKTKTSDDEPPIVQHDGGAPDHSYARLLKILVILLWRRSPASKAAITAVAFAAVTLLSLGVSSSVSWFRRVGPTPTPTPTLTPTPTPMTLSGNIERVVVVSHPGGEISQVFLLLSVMNDGPPTSLNNYLVQITHVTSKSLNYQGPLEDLDGSLTLPPAGEADPVTIGPEDSLIRKTIQPVPSDRKVIGWVRLSLPLPETVLQQSGLTYTVSFADATGRTYTVVHTLL